jgi:hypothetical protein
MILFPLRVKALSTPDYQDGLRAMRAAATPVTLY